MICRDRLLKSIQAARLADVATYLNIEEGYPLLSIRSTVSSPDGQKIHRSKQLILGDKFELIV
ncbi:UTRA domain-containing protein [Paenibacillus graminis]